ncbi:MAG: hypothetical protein NW205_06890 [Hyphomicrobiaceae bacterium]|nr:hypothetical protein [Hyphomicrobiaceae bacterium]
MLSAEIGLQLSPNYANLKPECEIQFLKSRHETLGYAMNWHDVAVSVLINLSTEAVSLVLTIVLIPAFLRQRAIYERQSRQRRYQNAYLESVAPIKSEQDKFVAALSGLMKAQQRLDSGEIRAASGAYAEMARTAEHARHVWRVVSQSTSRLIEIFSPHLAPEQVLESVKVVEQLSHIEALWRYVLDKDGYGEAADEAVQEMWKRSMEINARLDAIGNQF